AAIHLIAMFDGIHQRFLQGQANSEDLFVFIVVLAELVFNDFLDMTGFTKIAGNDKFNGSILKAFAHGGLNNLRGDVGGVPSGSRVNLPWNLVRARKLGTRKPAEPFRWVRALDAVLPSVLSTA